VSRLLLDTCAYSAAFRGEEPAKAAIRAADAVYLNPIVIGELLAGFSGGRRGHANERQLREFLQEPLVGVIDIDDETADRYSLIVRSLKAAGTPIPANDIWIAASAMQHGLELLTADAHFDRVAQIVVRPLRFS